ncbi:nucleotide exchange factor GrpE [Candidatus Bathyarchaeota archaeon]|nr:MAG: nucleotide exchange factor GrpE [Candidatus Bathyarchaeota archaeon]
MIKNDISDFFGGRRYLDDPNEKIVISKKQLKSLQEKAEQHDNLSVEFKDLKAQNQELKKKLSLLKEDERNTKGLQEQTEKYYNSLVRVQADFDNYKKNAIREKNRFELQVKERVLKKLLRHYDDLLRTARAIEFIEYTDDIKKGFDMILKNFEKLLEEECVIPMNCEGEVFDPYKHEAMLVQENDDLPENVIIEELDKGYYLNNEVLRPARVAISQKSKTNQKSNK